MKTQTDSLAPMMTPEKHADALLLTRRSFMIGSVAGSLVMGFGGLAAIRSARAELAARNFSPAVWFEMDANGRTLINIAKAEMG